MQCTRFIWGHYYISAISFVIYCHDCDTLVGAALSNYSSYDRQANKWQMTLYNMAYHWLPLCLSQEKWIVGFWNMQVQQMWWRKLLTAFIAIVTMWWIVMQLILQQWVKLKHTPHHVAWKLGNTVDKNDQSVHFIPTHKSTNSLVLGYVQVYWSHSLLLLQLQYFLNAYFIKHFQLRFCYVLFLNVLLVTLHCVLLT